MATHTVNPVQVQKFLKNVDYPAAKDELLQTAELEGADEAVLDTLRRIPLDTFSSPNDISEGIVSIDEDEG